MDATTEPISASTREYAKSRPGALIWFFRKSRDGWKRKYLELKSTEKGYKNRIADLTKSREQWRKKAEQTGEQLAAVEAEVAALQCQVEAADKKKRIPEVAR
jgi:SMC interacting uncharacterized protein involved in chromosome segregation